MTLPSVTSAWAPIRQFLPITALLRMVAPIPTSDVSPMVQPCSMARWPMVQFFPIVRGEPISVCSTQASWTLLPSPTWINSLSPLNTAANQTLAFLSRRTLPITLALAAIQNEPASGKSGEMPSSAKIAMGKSDHFKPKSWVRINTPCKKLQPKLAPIRAVPTAGLAGTLARPLCRTISGA